MASAAPPPAAASTATENPIPGSSSSTAGEGGNQDSTFECNICLDTSKDAVISLCGHLFCGWRPDLTDKCVQYAKQASVERKSSHYMAGEVRANRTQGSERLLDHRDRGQSLKIVVDFRVLVLEMEDSRCLLALVPFHLAFLLQLLTSMMEDHPQLPLEPLSTWMNSSCLDSFYLLLW
ncbi:E3 ubiquitin-protein ligase RNF185 isoform X2 [Oncorhynchus nerka]|uniref:E3 ubiquitin-protein ligase RNF185 isoform X2 n=1 Tax=Oncorhynchus nerka TaxID=8023 RepID=UPI0031B86D51